MFAYVHHQTGDFSWCFWGDQVPVGALISPSCSPRSTIISWLWQPGCCCLTANSRCFGVVTGAPTRWIQMEHREEHERNCWKKHVVLSCPSSVAHISCIFLGAAQKHQMKDMQSIAQRFVIHGIHGPQTSKLCRSTPVITNFRMHPNVIYWLQPCRKIGSNLEIRQASAWVKAKADPKPGGIALVLEESAVDCQPEFRLGGWLLPDESLLVLSLTMGKNPKRYPALGWSCKTAFFWCVSSTWRGDLWGFLNYGSGNLLSKLTPWCFNQNV